MKAVIYKREYTTNHKFHGASSKRHNFRKQGVKMSKIGPFFYIHDVLLCNACPLSEGRKQANMIDNSYGHEQLFDDYFHTGDYIDYPRGRVIWERMKEQAIIYIDPCIDRPDIVNKIIDTFELSSYTMASDEHYHCKHCIGELFEQDVF